VNWEQAYIDEQLRRLTHARQHADFFLDTNPLTPDQVCLRVIEFIQTFASRKP
jgi:hypothetical protein